MRAGAGSSDSDSVASEGWSKPLGLELEDMLVVGVVGLLEFGSDTAVGHGIGIEDAEEEEEGVRGRASREKGCIAVGDQIGGEVTVVGRILRPSSAYFPSDRY